MKSADDWTVWIVDFMQKNPVSTPEAARAQIKVITKLIQNDVIQNPPAPTNDNGESTPDAA